MDITFPKYEETYKMDNTPFLGEGPTGKCWKVINQKDGKAYALKITKLPKDKTRKNELMDQREYLRSLGHDNILQYLHFTIVTEESEG